MPAALTGLDLDAEGPRARSRVLERALRDAVRAGSLPAGAPLPSTRALADALGTSRGVVVRAYGQLAAEGHLVGARGEGTHVADVPHPPTAVVPPLRRFGPTNPGQPDPRLFPRGDVADALARTVRDLPDAALGYGDPRGLAALRTALAGWLARTRAVVCDPDQVVVTTGYAQSLALVATVLGDRGEVAVEDPGSAGVVAELRALDVPVRHVPVDDRGLRVEALPMRGVAAVVVTPAHQFPTGAVMSPDRRRALAAWASSTGGYVLEDDYDREFRYGEQPVGSLHALAPAHVLHAGSVAKLLSPALRLGWLVAPPRLLPALVDAKFTADIATSTVLQGALALLLGDGALDRATRRAGAEYGRRRTALADAVAAHLPGWRLTGDAAGLHAVLRAPDPADEARLLGRASEVQLQLEPVASFAHVGVPPGLVVGYGRCTPRRVAQDVAVLSGALR